MRKVRSAAISALFVMGLAAGNVGVVQAVATPECQPEAGQVKRLCDGTALPGHPWYYHRSFHGSEACEKCQQEAEFWFSEGYWTYCRWINNINAELYTAKKAAVDDASLPG